MKIHHSFCLIVIFFCSNIIYGQVTKDRYENEERQEQMDYDKEFTYGINWNTNGSFIGGFNFKYAWQRKISQFQYNQVGFEVVSVVHPRELSFPSQYSNNSFVYGKNANFYVLRFNYGREILLFNKAQEEGVQISWIVAAGPSLGYKKPYYIYYVQDSVVTTRVYTPDLNAGNIYGSVGFFKGLDEMVCYLGVHAKTSLNFEFGRFKNSVTGAEVGAMLEAYGKQIIIIPQAENRAIFPSLFINLYFGIR